MYNTLILKNFEKSDFSLPPPPKKIEFFNFFKNQTVIHASDCKFDAETEYRT